MTVVVKQKSNIVVPPSVQRKARIRPGDRLEFQVSGGVITILPKLPSASGEYTAEQRRRVDAELAEALGEVRRGKVSPRFDSVDEMLASLKAGGSKVPRRKPPSK